MQQENTVTSPEPRQAQILQGLLEVPPDTGKKGRSPENEGQDEQSEEEFEVYNLPHTD